MAMNTTRAVRYYLKAAGVTGANNRANLILDFGIWILD
jgi:hypothetical protein